MKRILPKAALLTVVCLCLLAAGFALPTGFGSPGGSASEPAVSTTAPANRADGAVEEPEITAPLAAPQTEATAPESRTAPGWAVLNLLLGAAGITLAAVAAIGALRRASATGTALLVLWRLATVLAGVGALAVFLFSSTFGGGFALANQWTLLTAFLVVFQVLGLLMLNRLGLRQASVEFPTEE